MDFSNFFGRPFEDWKRDAKDFADHVKGMASEGLHHDWEPGCGFKFKTDDPFFSMNFYLPRTNIFITADRSLVFEFMLAGFDERNVSLNFKGDKMILRARLAEGEGKREDLRFERRAFSLREIDHREFSVPADRYDQAAAKAVFKNGILTVTIPALDETEAEGAVKIEIIKEGN
jgi:HSP20 family molecular chaperone IbpA